MNTGSSVLPARFSRRIIPKQFAAIRIELMGKRRSIRSDNEYSFTVVGKARAETVTRKPYPHWLTRSAIRTAANTESKLLMLTHACEVWQVLRVCFHTDARNQRSRAALERIGGQFEGILRVTSPLATPHATRSSNRTGL